MKRLVENESLQDGSETFLADLLRAVAPFRSDPFRKRRILVRLERTPAPPSANFWTRPGVVLALLAFGSAAAALGQRYSAQSFGIVDALGAAKASLVRVLQTTTAQRFEPAALAAPPAATGSAALTTADTPPNEAPEQLPVSQVRAELDEDARDAWDAIEALRSERDPVRARALLDDYLTTHERVVLCGDALALSIQTAAAHHDPRAAEYARRYLAAYPSGEYRALATRALHARAFETQR